MNYSEYTLRYNSRALHLLTVYLDCDVIYFQIKLHLLTCKQLVYEHDMKTNFKNLNLCIIIQIHVYIELLLSQLFPVQIRSYAVGTRTFHYCITDVFI